MKEFYTDNGVRVVINPAPMKLVKQLRRGILRQLRKQNIDVGNPKSLKDLTETLSKDFSKYLNIFKDILIDLELDESFDNVLMSCLEKCTYNNIGISETLFDSDMNAREEYDHIRYECLMENLKYFFKNPLGWLNALNTTKDDSQE